MPKVKKVVARKDYPKFGIVKGQEHYHWVLKTGPRSSREFRQSTPPKRGQLTSSEFLSSIYNAVDVTLVGVDTPDDVHDLIEEIRNAKDEVQERFDNMPESLQQGSTGQMLEQRISSCDNYIASLEEAQDTWESAYSDELSDEEKQELKDAFIEEAQMAEPGWE